MVKLNEKDQKILNLILKKAGITLSGFKQVIADRGYRINDDNVKYLLLVMAGTRISDANTMKLMQKLDAIQIFIDAQGKKTITSDDITNFYNIIIKW